MAGQAAQKGSSPKNPTVRTLIGMAVSVQLASVAVHMASLAGQAAQKGSSSKKPYSENPNWHGGLRTNGFSRTYGQLRAPVSLPLRMAGGGRSGFGGAKGLLPEKPYSENPNKHGGVRTDGLGSPTYGQFRTPVFLRDIHRWPCARLSWLSFIDGRSGGTKGLLPVKTLR